VLLTRCLGSQTYFVLENRMCSP